LQKEIQTEGECFVSPHEQALNAMSGICWCF